MAKGIKVGNLVKVSFPKTGNGQKGMWQFFTYNETVKNQQTGEYNIVGKYMIWVNNPNPNIQHGNFVRINSITSAVITKKEYNGMIQHTSELNCDVELQAPYTPQLINNQPQQQAQMQQQPNFEDYNFNSDELPFD